MRWNPRRRHLEYHERYFFRIAERFIETIEAGDDVLVHCVQSYHRAPVVTAALMRRATGCNAQVSAPFHQHGAQPRCLCIAVGNKKGPSRAASFVKSLFLFVCITFCSLLATCYKSHAIEYML